MDCFTRIILRHSIQTDYSINITYTLGLKRMLLPVKVVTIAEHIGDHTVLSEIWWTSILEGPGLHRTLIGGRGRNSRYLLS